MKTILFNCTTNVVGGGVQNAANFIAKASQYSLVKFYFAVSPQVDELLSRLDVICERFVFGVSPARSLAARKKLRELAKSLNVDLVYTMAGPAYVDFKSIHVLGVSDPYVTHSDLQGYIYGRGFREVLLLLGVVLYKMLFSRRADYFVFQTDSSRYGFCKRLFISSSKTYVVPNALGASFAESVAVQKNSNKESDNVWRVFCPGAAYVHKSFDLVPLVVDFIRRERPGLKFEFILTLPFDSSIAAGISAAVDRLLVHDFVRNIGPYSYADALGLYRAADVVFIPSVLEVFSTSYLEAIALRKPLVCADKHFSREICENGAMYFRSGDYESAARLLLNIFDDYEGKVPSDAVCANILSKYGNYDDRFANLISVLEDVFIKVDLC